jgi:hypothetical protein
VVNPGLILLQKLIIAITMPQAGCAAVVALPILVTLGFSPGLPEIEEVD